VAGGGATDPGFLGPVDVGGGGELSEAPKAAAAREHGTPR
jgi:hypothetical protein